METDGVVGPRIGNLIAGLVVIRQWLTMRIPGERVRRTRLFQTEKYVATIEVEMIIYEDDPSEPCYDAETIRLLSLTREHAERGDLPWLVRRGKLGYAVGAA